jgi:lysylphosphatidylglycerol synthetase-like protein (DUF2156 family)
MDGRVVGFAAVVPVPPRRGWFIEDLIRAHEAPNGNGELLVDAVMRWEDATGSSWVTLGLAPLDGEVAPALRVARRGGAELRSLHHQGGRDRPHPAGWWSGGLPVLVT